MIITGYQGIGKSTLARNNKNFIDLESSCFWKTDENGNRTRPDWYVYYCQMAQYLSRQGYTVFVSCHPEVRDWLSQHRQEKFCTIFPSPRIKGDWLNRLQERYLDSQSEKDLRALSHAEDCYDKDIENLLSQCKMDYYSNAITIDDIHYDLEKLIEKL